MGIHTNEYPASQKTDTGDDGYRSQYNAGTAPGYATGVATNLGSQKPKGTNITEGGFDPNAPNASFNSDIGTRNDPGRATENTFQKVTAETGPYGTEARWQKKDDGEHWYSPLQRDQAA